MATGDVYQCRWEFTETGLGTVYKPGFQVRQDGVSFDAATVATKMRQFWATTFGTAEVRSYYATELSLTAVLIRRIKPLEDLEQRITTSLPILGTSAADRLAPENAPLMSIRTARIGRSRRGRCYLPAPTEAALDEPGWWTTAFANDLVDAWAGSVGTLGAVGTLLPQVVFSRVLDDAEDVTLVKVDRRVRSQRRRNIETPSYIEP